MIVCKEMPTVQFATQKEMFKALVDYRPQLIALKKSAVKFTDEFNFSTIADVNESGEVTKANNPVMTADLTEIKVKVVMNTTNLLDSHGDVHIKDIWKRSLSRDDRKIHLQEHKQQFDKVISDDALAYTQTIRWKTLGYEYEGSTQALIFESLVTMKRNKFMFEQYANGWVKQHSVGMQYLDMNMCLKSEENWAKDYKENWEKYYPMVANKEDADQKGYFWAITEAKLVEGSAVLFGSNYATPTLDNNMKSEQSPSSQEPDTAEAPQVKSYYTGFLN